MMLIATRNLLDRYLDAWNAHDPAGVARHMADGAVYEDVALGRVPRRIPKRVAGIGSPVMPRPRTWPARVHQGYRPRCSPTSPLIRMCVSHPRRISRPTVTRSPTSARTPPPTVNAPSLDVKVPLKNCSRV